jgi:TPR repeat protein
LTLLFMAAGNGAGIAEVGQSAMRSPLLYLLVALLLVASPIAQGTREDGLRAFVDGDYARAAQILGPLAEPPQSSDGIAQFFMAMLYDTGEGVGRSTALACGLFQRAAAGTGPFVDHAALLARALREETTPGALLCPLGPGSQPARSPLFGFAAKRTFSTAGEALVAIAREDYTGAANLLTPFAEVDGHIDPAAQFLLASLYDSGHGVPLDPLRACALYHSAARDEKTPFGREALRLMLAMFRARGNGWFADCQALAYLGLDHRFEPATFNLGPGHTITWNLDGPSITYEGRTKRVSMRLAPRGAMFLPLRHTVLRTGPGPLHDRHFIEVYFWERARLGPWVLHWNLFEVVRDEVVLVTGEPALMTRGTRPSAADVPDPRDSVVLRVDERALAQWAIIAGDRQRTGPILSIEERRQAAEQESRRAAALAQFDWSRTLEVSRRPSLNYGSGGEGCGHMVFAEFSDDRAEAITIIVDGGLRLSAGAPRTIDLARETRRVSVSVHVFDRPLRRSPFCHQVAEANNEAVWRAVRGRVTILLSSPRSARETYRATIRLESVEFVSNTGQKIRTTSSVELTGPIRPRRAGSF